MCIRQIRSLPQSCLPRTGRIQSVRARSEYVRQIAVLVDIRRIP
eukprot:COSAG02_NODE_54570_length_295_cov_0.948980_1_plen_43_part_10